MHTKFWSGSLNRRNHLGNPGIDEMIILRRMLRKQGVDCIQLAQNRFQ
jgi:hypothetical protein